MSRPIVALLTDFGTRDHYVGTMKGVMLDICPDATLVDITHDIGAHDVASAALELHACYRYFPAGTVFLVVVDPGVGSTRRAIGVDVGDYRFVAPDNGVLALVLTERPPHAVVELQNPKYARATVSRTFEGRDRFAPAAGWLARGVALSEFGPLVTDLQPLVLPQPVEGASTLTGHIVRIDRFGNLITNIDRPLLFRFARDRAIAVDIGELEITRVVRNYAEAPAGRVCALFSSSDHLEIAVNGGNASEQLKVARGTAVRVRRL